MTKKQKSDEKWTSIIIGYVPLLMPDPKLLLEAQDLQALPEEEQKEFIERIGRAIEETEEGPADFMLWLPWPLDDVEHAEPMLTFGMEKALQIADHLKWWSEESPEEWFEVYIEAIENKYAVVLFPNIGMTRKRFMLRFLLEVGKPVREDEFDALILYKPITFVSQRIGMYEVNAGYIGDEVHVGLIEAKGFDPMKQGIKREDLPQERIYHLGKFKRGTDPQVSKYIHETILRSMEE